MQMASNMALCLLAGVLLVYTGRGRRAGAVVPSCLRSRTSASPGAPGKTTVLVARVLLQAVERLGPASQNAVFGRF